jgi:hypothetical protein
VQANPFDYQAHVALIDALRGKGERAMLAHARQRMSEAFPLTEGTPFSLQGGEVLVLQPADRRG